MLVVKPGVWRNIRPDMLPVYKEKGFLPAEAGIGGKGGLKNASESENAAAKNQTERPVKSRRTR